MPVNDFVRHITSPNITRDSFQPACAFCDPGHHPFVLPAFRLDPPSLPSLYTGNNARSLAAFSKSDLAGKPSHRPHLHENNNKTRHTLFPFLYNGFRVSPEMSHLRQHSR